MTQTLHGFVRALALFLVEDAAVTSIKLEMQDPLALKWARLRNETGIHGYPTVEEAEAQLTAFLHQLVVPVPAPGGTPAPLTQDEWDLVHDALVTEEGLAEDQADLWKGRKREDRYRREALEARRIRQTLANWLEAAADTKR